MRGDGVACYAARSSTTFAAGKRKFPKVGGKRKSNVGSFVGYINISIKKPLISRAYFH